MAKQRRKREKHIVILICGKSGAGKSSVADELERIYKLRQLPSYTTRPPRSASEKGHIFITETMFNSLEMLTYTRFNGYEYGATREQIEISDVYVIDINGIKAIKDKYPGRTAFLTVYINCNVLTRYKRMRKRGDSRKEALKRIIHDRKAFKDIKQYADITIKNNATVTDTANDIYRLYKLFRKLENCI